MKIFSHNAHPYEPTLALLYTHVSQYRSPKYKSLSPSTAAIGLLYAADASAASSLSAAETAASVVEQQRSA